MRILLRAAACAIITLLISFALDCGVFELRRISGGGMGSVPVDQFLSTSLKGNKTEYEYVATVNQSCSRTLFPQYAASQWNPPCWWLQRHRARWETVTTGNAPARPHV